VNAVLLLVDLQEDFLRATPELMPSREDLIRQAARLLDAFRQRGLPVFHVWTTLRTDGEHRFPHWPRNPAKCIEGTPGHCPPHSLRAALGERVFRKQGFNPFVDGQLENSLATLGRPTVVIAGVHLHACVRTAVVECLERGYSVIVAEDAVGTDDPLHAAATRRWLSRRCARFRSAAACMAELEGHGSTVYQHRSPRALDEVCFAVSCADTDAIETAAAGARRAQTRWRREPLATRLDRLAGLAGLLRAEANSLARQMAVEIGKPLTHGLEEIQRAAQNIQDVVRRLARTAPVTPALGAVRGRPLGVVALITPWNNPVAIPLGKIVPALAYGNAAVWKPAPAGTGVARNLAKILDAAGLPRELVPMVEGDATAARSLAAADAVSAVSITGSPAAGFSAQDICARRSIPLQAELGGNNAAIVWEAANLDKAAAQIVWGALAFAGQRCTANRRVIVPESGLSGFLELLTQAAGRLVWGDPLDPHTDIGPVISPQCRSAMEACLADTQTEDGLDYLLHPHAQPRLAEPPVSASYARPTLVVCRAPDHVLVREEWMAPLLVVQPAADFDHAMALCNGVRHGLAAALFSQSKVLQQQFLEDAQAGILKINASTAGVDPSLPFGGWKASGLGPPEHGEGDALFYQRLQTVYGEIHPPREGRSVNA